MNLNVMVEKGVALTWGARFVRAWFRSSVKRADTLYQLIHLSLELALRKIEISCLTMLWWCLMGRLKHLHLKILSVLVKNSTISDRELAKIVGSSQPTVSRVKRRLEKEGYIREYTMIPDFGKLGYELLAVTLVKLKSTLTPEEIKKAQELSVELAGKSPKTGPYNVLMAERGMGMGYNGVFITCHENYQSYMEFRQWLMQFKFFEISHSESFLIDLRDKIRYLPLTFSNLANHIPQLLK